MALVHLTREQVVARALNIFPECYYVWGGYPNHYATCVRKDGKRTAYGAPSDCSGFTSWAWGLGQHCHSSKWSVTGSFGARYVRRVKDTGTLSERFPGIQPGDVLNRSQFYNNGYRGHVALYIGNNQLAELYTGNWQNSLNGHGSRITSESYNFMGYVPYEESYSGEYDDEEDDPITFGFTNGGQAYPGAGTENLPFPDNEPGDISDVEILNSIQEQYTRRFWKMKQYRRR